MGMDKTEKAITGAFALIATIVVGSVIYDIATLKERRTENKVHSQRVAISCDQSRSKILSIVRYEPPLSQYGMNKSIDTQEANGSMTKLEAKVAREIVKNADLWVSVPVGVRYVSNHPFDDFREREATAWRIGNIACVEFS